MSDNEESTSDNAEQSEESMDVNDNAKEESTDDSQDEENHTAKTEAEKDNAEQSEESMDVSDNAKEESTDNSQDEENHTAKTEAEKDTSFGGYASIEEFTKSGYAAIVKATKTVNSFPQGTARDFYCSYPTFGKIIDEKCSDILRCISKVMKTQNMNVNLQNRSEDERFELLQECNDAFMERLKTNLDEYGGAKKVSKPILIESTLNPTSSKNAGSWNLTRLNDQEKQPRLLTAKNIVRPQSLFRTPVDNSVNNVFVPKLKDKPNSLKPLAILPEYNEDGDIVSYVHPYEFELMKFQALNNELKSQTPQMPLKLEDSNYVNVKTLHELQMAINELREENVIAIDVEHHSYRSFMGITCLVQISSRTKDYLLDALDLREDLHLLNEITTDTKIIKILHGATMDIEWLQRDLGVYIVNMFDTYQAAKLLNFSRLSLAFLLKHYCNIDADKTYQLADWRIRPMPDELITYARQDTHYLIYIFENLVNDLIGASDKSNLIRVAYDRSTDLCKIRYVKPTITEDSYMELFRKSKRNFDNRQLFAMREIFNWRDAIARQEDESYGYVLPNHMLVQIAESLPREMQGIVACCNPLPPLVRQNLPLLHRIILKARAEPLIKPVLHDPSNQLTNYKHHEYNTRLYYPHDLTNMDEFRDDLPLFNRTPDYTLVKFKKADIVTFEYEESKPECTFENLRVTSLPYQRYLKILPVVEKEKLEEQARIEAANKLRKLCPDAPTIKNELADDIPSTSKNIKKEHSTSDEERYSLPIKKQLKRLHEDSIAKKVTKRDAVNNNESTDSPANKRKKTETITTNDKLHFLEKPTVSKQVDKDKNKQPMFAISVNSSVDDSRETVEEDDNNKSFRNDAKKRFKNKKKKSTHTGQSSSVPVNTNFNYKAVDFQRFKGGAQRSKGIEINAHLHGKSNNSMKKNNKKLNKLFTFSNVKGNK